VTGVFDEPILVFALSGMVVLFGFYLLYAPGGNRMLMKLGGLSKKLEQKVTATELELREEADPRKQFEKKVISSVKKKSKN